MTRQEQRELRSIEKWLESSDPEFVVLFKRLLPDRQAARSKRFLNIRMPVWVGLSWMLLLAGLFGLAALSSLGAQLSPEHIQGVLRGWGPLR